MLASPTCCATLTTAMTVSMTDAEWHTHYKARNISSTENASSCQQLAHETAPPQWLAAAAAAAAIFKDDLRAGRLPDVTVSSIMHKRIKLCGRQAVLNRWVKAVGEPASLVHV